MKMLLSTLPQYFVVEDGGGILIELPRQISEVEWLDSLLAPGARNEVPPTHAVPGALNPRFGASADLRLRSSSIAHPLLLLFRLQIQRSCLPAMMSLSPEDQAIRTTCTKQIHQALWLQETANHQRLKVTYSTTTNFDNVSLPAVLFIGPMFSTRWHALHFDKLARDCGVRLICVDRYAPLVPC